MLAVSLPSALFAEDTGPPPHHVTIEDAQLQGRWHLVEVVFELDEINGVGSKAYETLARSRERQAKVRDDIRQGKIAIISQFNPDGSYSHEVVSGDTGNPIPYYREHGRWHFDPASAKLTRKSTDQEVTTLEECTVTRLTDSEIELRVSFTEGENKGIVEINRLRKHSVTRAIVDDN